MRTYGPGTFRVATAAILAFLSAYGDGTPWDGMPSAHAAGDVQAGRKVARQACAECHRMPSGRGGGNAAPLAAYRDQQPFTASGLRKLVGSWPHAGTVKLPADPAYPNLAAYLNDLTKTDVPSGQAGATDNPTQERQTPGTSGQADRRPNGGRSFGETGGGEEHEFEEYEEEEDEGWD